LPCKIEEHLSHFPTESLSPIFFEKPHPFEFTDFIIKSISDVILSPISLPPAINVRKEQDGNYFCFVFTHKELGKLGRIVLIPHLATGQTEIKCEIFQKSGFSADAKKREEIFYPLAKELIARMEMGLAK
jgi:hypothetical protein